MLEVQVCIGSSCHIKGSPAVIQLYEQLIRQYKLQKKVVLKASFCQQACTHGIAVKIDGRLIADVRPENNVPKPCFWSVVP